MKQKLLFTLIAIVMSIGTIYAQKIAFLENRSSTFQNHQDGMVQELRDAGYQVTVVDIGIKPINFDFLNTQDLVILSRTVNSNDVVAPATAPDENWAKLAVPYLNLSVWSIRNNRLKLVNSTAIGASDDKTDLISITKAKPLVSDPVFNGVTFNTNAFDCYKGYFEFFDDMMEGNSGTVMAVLNDDAVKGANRPVMIRWAAGQATYSGGVTNLAPRTFLCIGSDNSPQNPNPNYSNYTQQSLRLFMNEVIYLISLKEPQKNGKTIAFVENRSSTYLQYQDPIIQYLSNAGYTVDKVSVVGLDPSTLSIYDLVIIGRNTYSTDFTNKAQSWAGFGKPYLILSAYPTRPTRLQLVGATTVSNFSKDSIGFKMTKAKRLVSDPVFNGVTNMKLSGALNYTGKTFNYYTGFYDYLDYTPAQFANEANTGKIMAVLGDSAYMKPGIPVFVRWEAGKETYKGSGVTNAAPRSFLQIGSDNGIDIPHYNNYTTASLRLLRNEVLHLISPELESTPNLIINGDFEMGLGGIPWYEDNGKDSVKAVYTANVNDVNPVNGKYDFLFDVTSPGINAGRPYLLFYASDTIFKDKEYTFSFITKVISGTPAIYSMSYGAGLKNFGGTLEGEQVWSYDFKATSNMRYVLIYFNGTQVGKLQIDDIRMFAKESTVNNKSIVIGNNGIELKCYPNPFRTNTRIEFNLNKQTSVTLSVYDLSGRIVRTLVNKTMPAGINSVTWNGDNDSGQICPSGLYFYRFNTDNHINTGKILLQK